MKKDLTVHILFRFSKKTGNIDTTMVGLGSAMMKMWALNNTPKTKQCVIVERDTGIIEFTTTGTDSGFPEVDKSLGSIEDFGIPLDVLRTIKDERFDK